MNWILITLKWYVYLLALGIIFFPVVKRFFSAFFDQGYAFSKTIAILTLSFLTFILGLTKILPFSQPGLFFILAGFSVGCAFVFFKKSVNQSSVTNKMATPWLIIIFEEVLFLISLFFLTYTRGQEPSIRGLEKFMDYGFINSILRAKYFPPLDMWLNTGPYINYYYFGHLSGAVLIKLTDIKAAYGYNLILATIFAQAITMSFSLCFNLVYFIQKVIVRVTKNNYFHMVFFGLLGSFIINFTGNLHTIYLFTSGYNTETPQPFWKILSWFNPTKYWYPNATRFIPFTIHEFPSYSYVVADLHGHVFDIPFVLLTLTVLFLFFINNYAKDKESFSKFYLLTPVFLGFMAAVHYMTNAFDGPIYILLSLIIFFIVYRLSLKFITASVAILVSFIVFSLPFSLRFSPFVTGIGVNCSPDFLINLKKIGPFIFEKSKCQASPLWMLLILWGFFFINYLILLAIKYLESRQEIKENNYAPEKLDYFILTLFTFGFFLIVIPEFFYIKDIYPNHFRANTMFKLGYQAFIMMGIASSYVVYRLKTVKNPYRFLLQTVFIVFFVFVGVYSYFAFPSYYGNFKKPVSLDGTTWLDGFSIENKEIINYLNTKIADQPTVLEAQGDSYTDYNVISAYTGLPTVAGWWVHEWLWRGSSEAVGKKIPDIISIYESPDLSLTKDLIRKYRIKYVVISKFEREKYKNLNQDKFSQLGTKIFESSNRIGALYQVDKQ